MVKSTLENPEEVFNNFRDESILNEERAKSIEGRLDYIAGAIKKLEVAKKRITEAFKAEVMTLPELRKEKTDIELSEEKLISERDALMMKLNVQHDVSAKIDLFKETCHKFLSKINDPKIVTERLKKDIIKLLIDEVVIEGESVKIFATIPLPNKIHEREMDKTDIPGTFNSGATLGPVNETNMARIWNKHKQSNTPLKRKVFVGLSGGVDSAVSAALLKAQGANVTGVFIKGWYPPGMPCSWATERRDAMRVAARLHIPFITLDASAEYKKSVIDYLLSEYRLGRTPNPDVMCNRDVKFGAFYQFAKEHGADAIATGHYRSGEKDQSYFLWAVPKEALDFTIFPVGYMEKSEVRKLAKKFNVPVAEKRDSQGVCFLGNISVEEFLRMEFGVSVGRAVDETGNTIGEHDGVLLSTIGERIGLRHASAGPWFVLAKDVVKNELVVGHTRLLSSPSNTTVCFGAVNWLTEHSGVVTAQYRYRGPLIRGHVAENRFTSTDALPDIPVGGQSIVFYHEGELLGGGIII